ncbi:hypothetical protein [Pseudomonas sp. OIL-1]|nr:hypothetical protein [Pseudomonas sp. OIL-1]
MESEAYKNRDKRDRGEYMNDYYEELIEQHAQEWDQEVEDAEEM